MSLGLNRSAQVYRWAEVAIRLVVGGLFVYAGAVKIGDPLAFADSAASFEILPRALIMPPALGLPVFEILCGALLLGGCRIGALGIAIAMALFSVAFASALLRGVAVDCGCFGSGAEPSALSNWLELARDVAILLAARAVYTGRFQPRPRAITASRS